MDTLVTTAKALARHHHAGQVDKQGRDYFGAHLVPIATALTPFGPAASAAGYLHDIIEDTPVSTGQLREAGISKFVVEAILSVTRNANGPESYTALIARSTAHPLGGLVKLADNTWNILSNPALAQTDPVTARRLLHERYLPARLTLLEATGISAVAAFKMTTTLRAFIQALEASA